MIDQYVAAQIVDASGLNCPMPVLLSKKAIAFMQVGDLMHIISTDPASEIDITAFACKFGHLLLNKQRDNDGTWHFIVQKV
ncbi:MAG: sulfurtransferase TusA family protein [Mariprofundaceae bacterium]|nr:sulfurtransferase TusA family protein [Mariprofundaceae bacterium]